jgi:hypothetical protein
MNKQTLLVGLAMLLVALLLAGIAGAQTSTDFDLSWYVMAGGGQRTDSPAYAMNSTLSQGIVGISHDTDFQMRNGYWYGATLPRHRIYLPLVLR